MRRRDFAVSLLGAPLALGQRIGDMRDPDLKYEEGWTSLFNGKDFGKLVVVLKGDGDRAKRYFEETATQQSTFYIENGLLKTTGTPNGYVRTSDVYDNYVFHCEVMLLDKAHSGILVQSLRDASYPQVL